MDRENGTRGKVTINTQDFRDLRKADKLVGVLFTGVKGHKKEDLISGLFQMKIQTGCCGKEYLYTVKTFPRQDLKCDCGKKGCWVVKYE